MGGAIGKREVTAPAAIRNYVSVDSLDRGRFHAITGHDRLDEILRGIELARGMGFKAVKLNAVLLKGLNDDQLPAWLDFLRERPPKRRPDLH